MPPAGSGRMFRFKEKPFRLGLQSGPIGSETVGGLRPSGDWRLSSSSGTGTVQEGQPNDDLVLGLCFVPGTSLFFPDRDWRFSFGARPFVPPPFLTYRATMEGGFRLTEDGKRRVVDAP